MKGILLALLLCSVAAADQRPVFSGELGESNESLLVWGNEAVRDVFRAVVWQNFRPTDKHIAMVIWWPLVEWDTPGEVWKHHDPVLVLAVNPGWQGHRGDEGKVELSEELHLIQLSTTVRP